MRQRLATLGRHCSVQAAHLQHEHLRRRSAQLAARTYPRPRSAPCSTISARCDCPNLPLNKQGCTSQARRCTNCLRTCGTSAFQGNCTQVHALACLITCAGPWDCSLRIAQHLDKHRTCHVMEGC
jgi:hypothetical protein